jgi:hypothetical protein
MTSSPFHKPTKYSPDRVTPLGSLIICRYCPMGYCIDSASRVVNTKLCHQPFQNVSTECCWYPFRLDSIKYFAFEADRSIVKFLTVVIMATLMSFLWSQPKSVLVLFPICIYYVSLGFYRLYLSPLAKFPGPKLAALTYWVEFYHDVVRRGQYTFEIGKMHEKYGESCLQSISMPGSMEVQVTQFRKVL